MRNLARSAVEAFSKVFSDDMRWVGLASGGAAVLFGLFCAYVYLQLTAVRPLLVFLRVDGEIPPVCGLCVLGLN